LNGFAGNVNVTATISPAGPGVSLSLPIVPLSGGVTRSVTLTLSTNGTTTPGVYTITLTGAGGIASHQVFIILTVAPPPTLSSPSQTLVVSTGSLLTFYVNASDTDPNLIATMSITYSSLPAGASFTTFLRQGPAGTHALIVGSFNWKPSSSQGPADYTITFTARDGKGGVSTSQVTIHVEGVSRSGGLLGSLSSLGMYSYAIFAALGAVAIVVVDRLWKQRKTRLALAEQTS
jgi:hypothetical protein